MRVIGITGGSGSGKTSVCTALKAMGYTIIDADKVAREIVEPGQPALEKLVDAFGKEILLADGTLNRKVLAKLAFSETEKLAVLNKVTHQYITETIQERIKCCVTENCVIDAPLLYESGLNALCDVIVGITARRDVRFERIQNRDSLTDAEANRRLDAQNSIEENIKNVDLCIDTSANPPLTLLAQKIDAFVKGVSNENN